MYNPIVDYFSFSIPIPQLISQWETSDRLGMGNLFDDRTSDLLELFASQSNWREFTKSGLMNYMIRFDDIGCTYMHGDKSEYSVIQFSGQGCKCLRESDLLEGVINVWADRCTRIDFANDFDTDADPEYVARSLSNRRFKTDSHEKSDTGKTWYVGSYKSDRYAAVYRYSDKLIRSNALRIEYRFSGRQAKYAASRLATEGVFSVYKSLHELYGWQHKGVFLATDGTKYESAPRPTTRAGKEFWLYNQVLPSLLKEAEKGNISLLIDLKEKLCAIIDEYERF